MLLAVLALVAGAGPGALPAPGAVSGLHPCEPGLRVTYAVERDERDTGARRVEMVLGPGEPAGTCLLERTREAPGRAPSRETWLLEHLPDRVAVAGWAEAPTLFRPPILKAPLEPGRAWTFERQRWRVVAVGARVTVPAGTFEGCVVVEDEALEAGAHRGRVTYAPGVGPVVVEVGRERRVAIAVARGRAAPRGDGGARRVVTP
jgi:hypothetical protein